jgi:hypothetical protein
MLFRRRRADRWPVDGSSPRACRVRTCNARTHRPSSANLLAGPPSQSEPFIIPPPARRRGSDIQAGWLGWLKVPCGNTPTTAKAPEEVGERIGGETHAFAEGRTRVPQFRAQRPARRRRLDSSRPLLSRARTSWRRCGSRPPGSRSRSPAR